MTYNSDIKLVPKKAYSAQPEHQAGITHRVGFSIRKHDGTLVDTIVRGFLRRQFITFHDVLRQYLTLAEEPNIKWTLRVDHRVVYTVQREGKAECMVSYQEHSHGYYAVVKLYIPSIKGAIS